jgi:hypothetical protein
MTVMSAANIGSGAAPAIKKVEKASARTSPNARPRRSNDNTIELSRALRIGRQLQAAAEWAGLLG